MKIAYSPLMKIAYFPLILFAASTRDCCLMCVRKTVTIEIHVRLMRAHKGYVRILIDICLMCAHRSYRL